MTSDPDEEALSWDGDDALDRPKLPKGWHAVGKGSDKVESESESEPAQGSVNAEAADERRAVVAEAPGGGEAVRRDGADDGPEPMSTAMLVSVGVLGGIYLLYTVGWVLGGYRIQGKALFLIPDVMYSITLWTAVAAPALWFLCSWVLTRGSKSWIRLSALIAGVLLLIPWPFVTGGGGA